VLLAGGLWLALRPPPWLLPDRPARRFGIAMAVAMVAGFVLTSRLGLAGVDLADAGMISYLLFATPSVVLVGPGPWRARRRRRQRSGAPPAGPRAD
jgi:drug/metabolite transporter (DMT)-like permease